MTTMMAPLRHMRHVGATPALLPPRPPARTPSLAAGRRLVLCQAQGEQEEGSSGSSSSSSSSSGSTSQASDPVPPARPNPLEEPKGKKKRRQADSSDWVTSALTRRFGIAGGLAWAGFLTFGVVSEQIKTRIEVDSEATNTREVTGAQEVETPEGLRYQDLKLGGGSAPQRGYLVILDFKAAVVPAGASPGPLPQGAAVFEDTHLSGRSVVFVYGAPPPASAGLCRGVELALAGMKGGGRRRVVVPAGLGFGDSGLAGRQGSVPPGATLEYDLELLRVSIPPS